mgnify:CR=1 FL=1
MTLKIENPKKRRKAEIIDSILHFFFTPFLGKTRKRKNVDIGGVTFKKILLIRPHHLGDFLMFTPALKSVRQRFPDAKITLLAGSWAKPLVKYNPHPDKVIYHDCPWWSKIRSVEKPSTLNYLNNYRKLFSRLRREKFDLAVDSLGDLRNILLFMQLPGARYKIGFERSGGDYFLTHPVPFDLQKHEVRKCFDLLRVIGITEEPGNLEVFTSEKEQAKADEIMKSHGLDEKGFLIIHPGARLKIKRWPEDRFASLAEKLAHDAGFKVVMAGDQNDRERMRPFSLEKSDVVNLCGEIDLLTLKALMEKARLFIGNSSLGMHLAAAARIPVFGILGPADAGRTAPWGVPYKIVQKPFDCSPCLELECRLSKNGYGACLNAVSVEEVYGEIQEFLKN